MLEHGDITDRVIGAAIAVHSRLGPGFIESVYERALCAELRRRGISHERQKSIPIYYEGEEVGDHRLDLLIEEKVIVETKAIKDLDRVYFAIVRSYLKAAGRNHGLILNFSQIPLEIRRVMAQ